MSEPTDEPAARPGTNRAGRAKTFVISVMILMGGFACAWLIFKTEPTATRGETVRETAMLVDVVTAERGTFRPTLEVLGQVVPAREVILRPRISGRVVEHSEAFTPGGTVAADELLLRIDPADYAAAVQQRRSELQQARADLALEQGRQEVAEQEFALLGESLGNNNRALVLREPQLAQAQAQIESAEALLRRAQLDLARTRIAAPFDAQILSREVTVGSQVNVGDTLARLVASDRYWVKASVPLSQLRWLQFSDSEEEAGSRATLRQESAWPAGQVREGRLYRLVGELEPETRLAQVLVTVDDPLALNSPAADKPKLILGAYVRTAIEGRPLADVVRLERAWIRRNDTVWVMLDGKLSIREADIVFRDSRYAYLAAGVASGEQVVTSDLASVVAGADLRVEGSE